jgi:hypothetical protein
MTLARASGVPLLLDVLYAKLLSRPRQKFVEYRAGRLPIWIRYQTAITALPESSSPHRSSARISLFLPRVEHHAARLIRSVQDAGVNNRVRLVYPEIAEGDGRADIMMWGKAMSATGFRVLASSGRR